MVDGRYTTQKDRMVAWAEHFQHSGVQPRLMYLVEGNTKTLDAKCGYGCTVQSGLPKATDIEVSL